MLPWGFEFASYRAPLLIFIGLLEGGKIHMCSNPHSVLLRGIIEKNLLLEIAFPYCIGKKENYYDSIDLNLDTN